MSAGNFIGHIPHEFTDVKHLRAQAEAEFERIKIEQPEGNYDVWVEFLFDAASFGRYNYQATFTRGGGETSLVMPVPHISDICTVYPEPKHHYVHEFPDEPMQIRDIRPAQEHGYSHLEPGEKAKDEFILSRLRNVAIIDKPPIWEHAEERDHYNQLKELFA